MRLICFLWGMGGGFYFVLFGLAYGQAADNGAIAAYRTAALRGGDPGRGKTIFESTAAGCQKCHSFEKGQRRAGPDLRTIGDKLGKEQLIQALLEPSVMIHPDFATTVLELSDGKVVSGVLHQRTKEEVQLFDVEGKLISIPVGRIESEKRSPTSLMPADLHKTLRAEQFADLVTYLESLKQPERDSPFPGMPIEISKTATPIELVSLTDAKTRFDHPVWVMAAPGSATALLVVEQKSRLIWRFDPANRDHPRQLFADFSQEASTGEFEGVVCLAFHPDFARNRKYYVNYHVRNQGSLFSPVIVERQATADLRRDAGEPSRRILQIPQDTDIHWGGMIAFGPDGYLYIGTGDAGPQEDPEGHSQNLSLLTGKILRIDVDRSEGKRPYAIPETNPFRTATNGVRPEIWAPGFRMPWRFSWDAATGDFWIGDVGQNLFERVTIAKVGENHGWNVYEGFMPFSERFRRDNEKYVFPVLSYRRKYGVSVTGGYVYRGRRSPNFYGAYIFGDFESKRIWAMTQADRKLIQVKQIGESPERVASFGVDAAGEILIVGYEGTIYRLALDKGEFQAAEVKKPIRAQLRRGGEPAAARICIVGGDGRSYAPAKAPLRQTKLNENYFYAEGDFEVELPVGRSKWLVSGGLETIPQPLTLDAAESADVKIELQQWIDLASRGWYAGDSHVHLHTGGPIDVTANDALVAAKAEGIHFANLCVSNNVGDDIRDPELITGRPHPASTDRHLLVFGEEMRSMIYGHMQFFGIKKLVEPQYTGFDDTPRSLDFPANFTMAAEAVRQGGIVTYGHPLFTGQPFPFEADLQKPNGAARELPIDAALGVVHAIDLMSYNSDEPLSTELWYRLLNCGYKLAACVGTDALLDRSTEPMGGDRMYVKTSGTLTMESWVAGLKAGRTFVTNGPIPTLTVGGKEPGETVELTEPGTIRVSMQVESLVPFDKVELIVNGEIAERRVVEAATDGVQTRRFETNLPVSQSSWVALRVRGLDDRRVFDGPAFAHTSPVYVSVAGRPIVSPHDAAFFVDWIEQMLRVVGARNRYARPEDRQEVERLFRKAQSEYKKQAAGK